MVALPVVWGPQLKNEYQRLFDTCIIHTERTKEVDSYVDRITKHKETYRAIATKVNIKMPWWFVGVIHHMEAGCNFKSHLHNGDPLTARTVRVPAGRPAKGSPPFTFEQSALDALINVMGYADDTDFSVARILYLLEGFNGYGYRQYHPQVKTPYLWSYSHHYVKGKYIEARVGGKWQVQWKPELVSAQCGIAVIIKRGFDLKVFDS